MDVDGIQEWLHLTITTLIPSIEQSVVEAIEAKLAELPTKVRCGRCDGAKDLHHTLACMMLSEIRTIIKAFKKE